MPSLLVTARVGCIALHGKCQGGILHQTCDLCCAWFAYPNVVYIIRVNLIQDIEEPRLDSGSGLGVGQQNDGLTFPPDESLNYTFHSCTPPLFAPSNDQENSMFYVDSLILFVDWSCIV